MSILKLTEEEIIFDGNYSPQDVLDLKELFLTLLKSHHKLADTEYKRNPSYNDSHYSAVAEQAVITHCLHNAINVVDLLKD